MSSKDAHLYGIPRQKKSSSNTISSSSSLAFSSQLSSLIASSASNTTSTTTAGRQRPRKKEDIFATHNKNSKKRAQKDLDDVNFSQKHSTSSAPVDQDLFRASKRKMEEKARLYAAMKRGDVEDMDEKFAVDFDRKWTEQQERGENLVVESSDDDDDGDSEPEEVVEYVDEFGRTRKGTRADVAREERRKRGGAADEPDRFTARPAMPSNIIYGDTVQADAFNPETNIAEQMAELAAKRDKEATPPPELHFDGKQEIRTKGVGFFHFSADEETRKKEMEALTAERERTEAARKEREKKKEERRREVEERRKLIQQKRGKAQADRFLDNLTGELEAKQSSTPGTNENKSP